MKWNVCFKCGMVYPSTYTDEDIKVHEDAHRQMTVADKKAFDRGMMTLFNFSANRTDTFHLGE